MRTRPIRLAAGLSALALAVAACGDDGGGGEAASLGADACTPISDGSAEGEELSVWIMEGTNPDATDYFDAVAAAFQEQTGATLDVQFVPWADAKDKFDNAIAGDTTPDVAEVGTTWTGGFAETGALVDLTACVDEAGLRDQLVPALVGSAEAPDGDGGTGLYGMPWYAGVRSVVYRTDVFEDAGVEPPTSWDELVEVGTAIKQAQPDLIPFPVPGGSEYGVYPFIWGAGGEIAVEEDGTWTSTVNSPAAQEGIEFYTDLAIEHGLSSPQASTWDEADVADVFSRGDAAMMIAGSWTPAAIVEANPDLKGKLGAFPIPGPEEGTYSPSFVGGSHLDAFSTAENPELAWTFIQLMTTGEFAQRWTEESTYFPGTTSELEKVVADEDPLVAPFATQMAEAGGATPNTPLWGAVQGNQTVTAMLLDILAERSSVAEATEEAAAAMDDVFSSGS
jgi:N,N'-diacetylchitobiose transport system substrate-binding protein